MRISDWSSDVCSSDLNVMWPFNDYTADNGATLIWPNSHGERALDPETSGEPIVAAMRPGAALLILGSTLHGAGRNSAATKIGRAHVSTPVTNAPTVCRLLLETTK